MPCNLDKKKNMFVFTSTDAKFQHVRETKSLVLDTEEF